MKFLAALLVSLSLLAPAYAATEKKTTPAASAPKKAKPAKIHKKVEGTKVPVKK
jgi:hypothetical protein